MKLVLPLATRGRPALLLKTLAHTILNIVLPNTEIHVLVDEDDEETITALTPQTGNALDPHIVVNIKPREDTLGGKYNRIMAVPADLYVAMVDYAPHVTLGFDRKLLDAAASFPDGIGFVHNHLANLSFSQIYGVTRRLAEMMYGIFPPYFPYWFIDHWIDDLGKMIERVARAEVWIDCSMRPGTMEMREPDFWATFYDAGHLERRRIARRIVSSPEFDEAPWRKAWLLSQHSPWTLIDERSCGVNNEVRNKIAPHVAKLPDDERYTRVKREAITALRSFVAELEAEQLTERLNQKAAYCPSMPNSKASERAA